MRRQILADVIGTDRQLTVSAVDEHGELQLAGGTISLQSESHPVEFRKVEIQLLDPPAAGN